MRTMTDWLLEAMERSAARQYGREQVTELAHALQCADLAVAAGADEELVLACLLHDVGRYAVAQEEVADTMETVASLAPRGRGHHEAGADLVAAHVSDRVAFLIRAHADAKRFLCATEPAYYDTLSAGSKHTMTLQGGIMAEAEATRAAAHPWWPDALRLRRWDDQAKVLGKPTTALSAWEPLLRKYLDVPARTR